METFPIPYFVPEEKYPESSSNVQFGRGWSFASAPRGPDQIEFILHLKGMQFFEESPGVLDYTTEPEHNMGVLLDFYEEHRMWKLFEFEHPFRGTVVCRFNAPIQYKVMENGRGLVEPFDVKLLLQPT